MHSRLFRAEAAASQTSTTAPLREHPPEFVCPISLELMTDPVNVITGHTFDRSSIESWFARGRGTNPVTGQRLADRTLTPNFSLRDAIARYNDELAQRPVAVIPVAEDIQHLIHQDARQFLEELAQHINTSSLNRELNLDDNAAKAYVATVFGLIRKRNLGLLLLPNTEETCCIPGALVPFITSFVMGHGTLMLAQQHPDFCKTTIEVPLNRGEELIPIEEADVDRSRSNSM